MRPNRTHRKKRTRLKVKEWAKALVYALAILFIVNQFFYSKIHITSNGMSPNIEEGDYLILNKWDISFKRSEIILISNPMDTTPSLNEKQQYLKRLIGLPGDTLEIVDGKIYINGTKLIEQYPISQPIESSYDIHPRTNIHCNECDWDLDNFGPIYIPKRNDTIILDSIALTYYMPILDSINVEEIDSLKYSFNNDQYFVLGDNRHHSIDSRFFGLVPKSHIQGTSDFIFFNFNLTKSNWINWNRIGKSIP